MTEARAEEVAANALAFLAQDSHRLSRFLATTGIGPADLRRAAGSRAVLASVLGHLLEDESLLLVFAAENSIEPDVIAPANALLAGPAGDPDT